MAILTGTFSLFGLLLFASLPYLVVVPMWRRREHGATWAVLFAYAWVFLGISLFQRRFAGNLAVVITPVLGAGLVDISSRLGVVYPVDPFGGAVRPRSLSLDLDVPIGRVYVLAITVPSVVSASFVPIPIKTNQVTYEPEEHDVARWMRSYADERGWEYPQNYVLSWWSDSRMYNYFVNCHSVPALRYSYARSNYLPFLSSASPEDAYQRHRDRVGFIVTLTHINPRCGF